MKWAEARERTHKMIRDVIILAKNKHPEMQSKLARGFYGVDTILDADINPKIFEFTFAPDTTNPTKDRSTFWSEVLGCMFYGDQKSVSRLI